MKIEKARVGEIDDLIRNVAAEYDAILVTGDNVQREIAIMSILSSRSCSFASTSILTPNFRSNSDMDPCMIMVSTRFLLQ